MKINTKQEFVDYGIRKLERIDSSQYFFFPTKVFEEIARDIAYMLGGDIMEKQVLNTLVEEEYNAENMNGTASYFIIPPTKEEILAKRVALLGKCWDLRNT
jgi:hypothetical protein